MAKASELKLRPLDDRLVIEQLAGADRDDAAALRLLLGAVGQQDAAGGFLFRFERLDDNAIIQGPNLVFFLAHLGSTFPFFVGEKVSGEW